MTESRAGFSIIRFSPNPEEIEHVNVALLLWGVPSSLHYRSDFPKLRCVAGAGFPGPMLEEYLSYVAEKSRVLSPAEAANVLNGMSAQVRVSPFRAAPRVTEAPFVEWLEQRYLVAHHAAERAERRQRGQRIEGQIDRVLERVLASQGFYRKPTAQELLGETATRLYGQESLTVTRAFKGTRGIVLVDALDLEAKKQTLEHRAGHLSYTFHRFDLARDALLSEGRQLRRIALFFGKPAIGTPNAAVHDWARQLLSSSTDRLVDAAGAEEAIESEAQRVGAMLGPN